MLKKHMPEIRRVMEADASWAGAGESLTPVDGVVLDSGIVISVYNHVGKRVIPDFDSKLEIQHVAVEIPGFVDEFGEPVETARVSRVAGVRAIPNNS